MYAKNVDEALEALTGQIEILKKKADEVISPPVKMIPYKVPSDFRQTIEKNFLDPDDNFRRVSTVAEVDRCLAIFKKKYDDCIVDLDNIHLLNVPIVAHNKGVRDKIILMMRTIGIFETYNTYEFKQVRSKEKTPTKHTSGYVDDLNRVVSVTDNYLAIKAGVDKTYALVQHYAEKLKAEINTGNHSA